MPSPADQFVDQLLELDDLYRDLQGSLESVIGETVSEAAGVVAGLEGSVGEVIRQATADVQSALTALDRQVSGALQGALTTVQTTIPFEVIGPPSEDESCPTIEQLVGEAPEPTPVGVPPLPEPVQPVIIGIPVPTSVTGVLPPRPAPAPTPGPVPLPAECPAGAQPAPRPGDAVAVESLCAASVTTPAGPIAEGQMSPLAWFLSEASTSQRAELKRFWGTVYDDLDGLPDLTAILSIPIT